MIDWSIDSLIHWLIMLLPQSSCFWVFLLSFHFACTALHIQQGLTTQYESNFLYWSFNTTDWSFNTTDWSIKTAAATLIEREMNFFWLLRFRQQHKSATMTKFIAWGLGLKFYRDTRFSSDRGAPPINSKNDPFLGSILGVKVTFSTNKFG